MKSCLLLVISSLSILCEAKIIPIEKIEVDIDNVYLKVSPKLVNSEVNLDIEILKDESDVMYQVAVYKHNVDHYEYFYKSAVESGCKQGEVKDPVLVFMFKEIAKYGNITEACPMKIGHYQLRGYKIDSDDIPHQLPSGSYRFDFTASIKKDGMMHDIYTDKYYFSM